jgi:hypothetical protein
MSIHDFRSGERFPAARGAGLTGTPGIGQLAKDKVDQLTDEHTAAFW